MVYPHWNRSIEECIKYWKDRGWIVIDSNDKWVTFNDCIWPQNTIIACHCLKSKASKDNA